MVSTSLAQSAPISVADWISRAWCLVVLVAAALLASPLSSIAQETRTQQIQLEQGWNLVSLNVQPDDSSFAALFGANVDQVAMIKNEEGEVYAPGEGIEQITTWKSGEGYQIHVRAPLTLGVTGTSIRPDSISIVLEEGGNVVPYLSTTAQGVAPALTSVEESLVAVEDDGGGQYAPSASSSLDSLRPGQAYKVYVDQSDTLRYPIVVSTLAEAKELEGIEVGKTIRMQGYHAPGDDGGGLFEVTDSGEETDGGTTFVFDEDVSDEKAYGISGWPTWTLPHSGIIWGTLNVRYGPNSQDVLEDLDMHGHRRKGSHINGNTVGWVDYDVGEIVGGGNPLKGFNQTWGDGSQEYTVTYKHATSDRRLERVHPPGVFNLAWWGAPKADPENPISSTPYINWAVNTAKERYLDGGVDWAYVDIAEEYYYLHHTKILDGVMLRGVGGGRAVPNRSFTTNGKLTLMPGKAIYYKRKDFDPVAEHDIYALMAGATRSTFGHEKGASEKLGIQNLEIDGNVDGNSEVFETENYENRDPFLQNSGAWAAWYTTGAGGQSYQKGLQLHINNVYAHGFGGNVFAGAGAEFTPSGTEFEVTGPNGVSKNVKVEDAVKNHQIYDLAGHMKDWSTAGTSWANPLRLGSKADRPTTFEGLTVENMKDEPHPRYGLRDVAQLTGLNMTLDDFTVDLSGFPGSASEGLEQLIITKAGSYYTDVSKGNVIKNSLIKLSPTDQVGLFRLSKEHALLTLKNVTIEDNGGGITIGSPFNGHHYNLSLEDVTVNPVGSPGVFDGDAEDPWKRPGIQGFNLRPKAPIPAATRNFFYDFNYNRAFNGRWLTLNTDLSASEIHPHDQYYVNSSFNSQDGSWKFLRRSAPDGDYVRVFLDNVTLNSIQFQSQGTYHGELGAGASVRMRNCQDGTGRTSDTVDQNYTATSSDESDGYALIPTSLMSRPGEMKVTANAGYNVTDVEVANSDGTMRADDDTDEEDPYLKVSVDGTITENDAFTWTARVTPMDEYKTTGLFVARKEDDKSYTSGGGSFTVDLRGMASSQESRDPVVYTASSGDTSVVTANVQSDDYTLELTEQSTGTATVTVTGAIDGVGTTTDTFQVTIE